MIYLFCIIIPCLLGRGALRAFYGKRETLDLTLADSMLVGGMIVIGLAEAAHMGAYVLGRSFSDCVNLFLAGIVVLLVGAALLLMIDRHKRKKSISAAEAERLRVKRLLTKKEHGINKYFFVFGVLVLIQVLQIVAEQKPYLVGDMTVETVNTMLSTDTIYQVNPMTGQPYTLGIPMRLKILCLPTLYGMLCEIFGMSAISVVWTSVPILTLLGCYAAFYTVSKALFEEDACKRGVFLIIVALIMWFGDSMYGLDGFGVQYAGFRGVSIRMAILLPYTFGLMLRKKWRLAVLCILAEACMVWTLYGMGACLLVMMGMILFQKKLRSGREEDSE